MVSSIWLKELFKVRSLGVHVLLLEIGGNELIKKLSPIGLFLTQCTFFLYFRYFFRKVRPLAVYGALFGVTWFFIHDYFLCAHGEKTLGRHLLAYSIGGSLLVMTLWQPSAITTGSLIGLTFGT